MNPRELVGHIRIGPRKLWLSKPTVERVPIRAVSTNFSNSCRSQSNETIRQVFCFSRLQLCITKVEWILLVKTLGRIRGIQKLSFEFVSGSRDFRPFEAGAHFAGISNVSPPQEGLHHDRLGNCWCLKELLQLGPATDVHLVLNTEHWFTVTDRIGQGHCNINEETVSDDNSILAGGATCTAPPDTISVTTDRLSFGISVLSRDVHDARLVPDFYKRSTSSGFSPVRLGGRCIRIRYRRHVLKAYSRYRLSRDVYVISSRL
jgi:hypothetical protein